MISLSLAADVAVTLLALSPCRCCYDVTVAMTSLIFHSDLDSIFKYKVFLATKL